MNLKQNTPFHNALKIYPFTWAIVEGCDDSTLIEREKYYIKHDSTLWSIGFNLTEGGSRGILCHEIIDRIGHPISSKTKIEIGMKGRKMPEATELRISQALRDRKRNDNG